MAAAWGSSYPGSKIYPGTAKPDMVWRSTCQDSGYKRERRRAMICGYNRRGNTMDTGLRSRGPCSPESLQRIAHGQT